MAPRLSAFVVERIEDALTCPGITIDFDYIKEIASNYDCSFQSIYKHKERLAFGRPAGTRSGGPHNVINWEMEIAIKQLLDEMPWFYQDEIAEFLEAAYGVKVSQSMVSRALSRIKITRKKLKVEAAQRNEELRNDWLFELQDYTAEQLVFLDESGSDSRTGDRQYGYSHRGSRAKVKRWLSDRKRVSILPAYTIEGYIKAKSFYGTATTETFEDFIFDQVLEETSPFPGPRSVLVMDNASIHHANRDGIEAVCTERGVRLLFLPPYSPDFNPIEESFGDLKAWIRRYYRKHKASFATYQDFIDFAVREVGIGPAAARRARAHFRNCGISGVPPN
jgi:transposase